MTKHAKILLPLAAFALALAFIFPMKVQAASLPFSVTPVVSHLQRDKSESYYDVIVKPGTSTKLQAKLVNNTNKAITVNAKVATAQTNDSGMVDYTDRKTADSTLKTKLTAILTGAKKVTIGEGDSNLYGNAGHARESRCRDYSRGADFQSANDQQNEEFRQLCREESVPVQHCRRYP